MSFRIDQLHRVLYKPRSAFEEIRPEVKPIHGVLLAIVLISMGTLISFGSTGDIQDMMEDAAERGELPEEILQETGMEENMVFQAGNIALAIISGVLIFFVSVVIAGWIASAWDKKEFDIDKNIGLLGYSTILDLITTLILFIVILLVAGSGLTGILAIVVIGLLFFIWELWIKGTGIAVANEVSTVKGMFCWLIATIILGLITGFLAMGFV